MFPQNSSGSGHWATDRQDSRGQARTGLLLCSVFWLGWDQGLPGSNWVTELNWTEQRSKQSNFYGSTILQEERKINAALWDPSFRAASFLAAALPQPHPHCHWDKGTDACWKTLLGKNEKHKKGNTKREKTAELTMCDFSVWLADGREMGKWMGATIGPGLGLFLGFWFGFLGSGFGLGFEPGHKKIIINESVGAGSWYV